MFTCKVNNTDSRFFLIFKQDFFIFLSIPKTSYENLTEKRQTLCQFNMYMLDETCDNYFHFSELQK